MSADTTAQQPVVPHDVLDLAGEPVEDDLERELAAKAPKQRINKITYVLAGLILVIGGFIAGSLVQKNSGTGTTATNTPTGGRVPGAYFGGGAGGNFPNFGGGTGNGGTGTGTGTGNGGGQGGSATTGTVKLVDGTTIYITTSS